MSVFKECDYCQRRLREPKFYAERTHIEIVFGDWMGGATKPTKHFCNNKCLSMWALEKLEGWVE